MSDKENNSTPEEAQKQENFIDQTAENATNNKDESNQEPLSNEGNISENTLTDTEDISSTPTTEKNAQQEVDEALAEDSEDEEANLRHEIEMKDYHSLTMNELIKELSDLVKTNKIPAIREHIVEIKAEFDAKYEEEFEQKKEDFLEEGGNIIDFHYYSPIKKKFDTIYFDYKEKRNNYYEQLKQNLNENLKVRLSIIEELKGMIGVGADMNSNFQQFKELQERWKKAGPVPRNQYNDIWRTYHHHVEHFYDFLHLDREFRDLDFKHNLDQKLKVIARAEELAEEKDTNRAFRELQMLHKMWKEEVGPVAKEYREDIWEKFSAATKKIHENRQAFFSELDKAREDNLAIKQELIEKIDAIANNEITNHSQAQQLIKEMESLRESFFKSGKVPQKNNQEIWTEFKEAIRKFNRNKNAFYKNLKKEQQENLKRKLDLILIAEENKDSEDFETVTPVMKKIQNDWKKIGYVPRKDSDKIWKRFKKACNHYFDRVHKARNEENKEELKAFEDKKELLNNIKDVKLTGDHQEDLKVIKQQIEAWKNIGRLPYNKRYLEGKFNKALDTLFNQLDIDRKQAEMLKYENRLETLDKNDNIREIEKEEFFLRKKISETKADINQLENNLQFFSNVDENNPLVRDVHKNIKKHQEQLETWKAKLKKIKAL
ncbi:broad specificity phosphatase PhoE [Mesonia hippocampi]|uniref:Broad specificity phosphatase PhoE n=1 Tax=Mesonia hippocampi TaxID=1628250 RepID=A0A840F0R3_9FLAO|nr:DUF349 domain-containing protein [Mesonia hippocampi]MBB4119854.1 broad specificity phosphatase PhoE [Mesonia hippocampi]